LDSDDRVADSSFAAGVTINRRRRAVHLRCQGLDGEGVVSAAGNQVGSRGVDAFSSFALAIPSDQPVVAWHPTKLPRLQVVELFLSW
jgi:hypothetical protein